MDEIRNRQRVSPDVETGVLKSRLGDQRRENRRLRHENMRLQGRLRRFAWVFFLFAGGFVFVQGLVDFENLEEARVACTVFAVCCFIAAWVAGGDQTREDIEDD